MDYINNRHQTAPHGASEFAMAAVNAPPVTAGGAAASHCDSSSISPAFRRVESSYSDADAVGTPVSPTHALRSPAAVVLPIGMVPSTMPSNVNIIRNGGPTSSPSGGEGGAAAIPLNGYNAYSDANVKPSASEPGLPRRVLPRRRRAGDGADGSHHENAGQMPSHLNHNHHLSKGGGGEGGGGRRPSSPFKVSLTLVFGLQSALVVAAFVALILMTSLMMDHATRRLVEQSISGDLSYARARILSPIQSYERILLTLRQSYISQSSALGRELCADSEVFSDSLNFMIDATIAIKNNPLMSYAYHLRRSDSRLHPIEGMPDVVECDVTPSYVMVINNKSRSSATDSIEFSDLNRIDSLPFEEDFTDYFYEDYVPFALSFSALTWSMYLYLEPLSNVTELYLSAYAPMKIRQTYANGTEVVFIPNLLAPAVLNFGSDGDEMPVSSEVLATYGVDVGMSTFITLMKTITPIDGAHTSLYDLAGNTLVCTSDESISLFNEDGEMWSAGETPSAAINEAYNYVRAVVDSLGFDGTAAAAAVVDATQTFASLDDQIDAPADLHVNYDDGNKNVISTISVKTSSGIQFLIVQSTPTEHYFSPVTDLRTIMIVVGILAAVAVVIVCVLVGFSIRHPLRSVAANMHLAAAMKNDRVEATSSILAEVFVLCETFERMNFKLLQARAFMPQAMLVDSSDEVTVGDGGGRTEDDGDEDSIGDGDEDGDEDGGSSPFRRVTSGNAAGTDKSTLPFDEENSDYDYDSHHHHDRSGLYATVDGDTSLSHSTNGTSDAGTTLMQLSTRNFQMSTGTATTMTTAHHRRQNKHQHGNTKINTKAKGGGGGGGMLLSAAQHHQQQQLITNRRVTVLVINVRDFHDTLLFM